MCVISIGVLDIVVWTCCCILAICFVFYIMVLVILYVHVYLMFYVYDVSQTLVYNSCLHIFSIY